MEENENRTSRSRFLKQIAATLAAAVGVGALSSRAYALPGQCCFPAPEHYAECVECGTNKRQCRCDCSGIGEDYCWTAFPQGCVEVGQCVQCGC